MAGKEQKQAEVVRELALEKAEQAARDPPDLVSLPAQMRCLNAVWPIRPMSASIAQAQRNFSDPYSHIMKSDDSWLQGYK